MRHLLIALVIALLPLRAWVGDAMAITMQMPVPTQEVVSASPAEAAPCPDHAMGESNAPMDHQHNSCKVCHGPAMPLAVQLAPSPQAVHGVLAPPTERFTSSVPQPGIKPPIF
ncbi:hypothetical protein [Hydrogenophaga sp.]|jgi:hypothetical protein|uniref:hypothetical protein n=1 Tax=Hydrogenophaga sp. TaxID=1904254 RepID=UPI003F6ED55E